jgi:hypothetical protein
MHEVLDEIVNMLTEEKFQNKMAVIFAGYKAELDELLEVNPGLNSRISEQITFDDFSAADCSTLLQNRVGPELDLDIQAQEALNPLLQQLIAAPHWSNGRDIETLKKRVFQLCAVENSPTITEPILRAAIQQFVNDKSSLKRDILTEQLLPQLATTNPPKIQVPTQAPQHSQSLHEAQAIWFQSTNENVQRRLDAPPQKSIGIELIAQETDPDESVYAVLLHTCVDAGYDSSHQKRQQLIRILEAVERGDPFPDDIMTLVIEKTNLTVPKATKMLGPQVYKLLEGMHHAVKAEDVRLAELRRLEEEKQFEEVRSQQEQQRRVQQRLAGLCPAGFSWHKCGSGWRCAGGSHFVSKL